MNPKKQNPLGDKVGNTSPAPWPSKTISLVGKYVTIEGLSPTHARDLFPLVGGEGNAHLWDYMPYDAYPADEATLRSELEKKAAATDPVFYTFFKHTKDGDKEPVGMGSFLRIDAKNRVIEVGHLMFSSQLQRSAASTEAMYLMMKYAFEELGYRRYEWKCHSLNAPSNRAALRLGFTFEGTFRRHLIDKHGRNRDTNWYSIIEEEWQDRKKALESWLDESNFDENAQQKKKLEDFQ